MRDKPNLQEDRIIACLYQRYGITVNALQFLPLGNDSAAWVYRADAADGRSYFVKLRLGGISEPSLTIPRYLKDAGIEQVVAPLASLTQRLYEQVEPFALIVYPFIDGRDGMEIGLTDSQWTAFGALLKVIHSTTLPAGLQRQMWRESFIPNPKWVNTINDLQGEIPLRQYDNPQQKEAAAFWHDKQGEISEIVKRAHTLGVQAKRLNAPQVLCHADIHTANLLISADGALHVVDWDQPIIAPVERDLMFVVGGMIGDWVISGSQAVAFFEGYGQSPVDLLTLTYYRYEWVVQEIGDYGARIFLLEDVGQAARTDSLEGFMRLFAPNDVVNVAYKLDHLLRIFRTRKFR